MLELSIHKNRLGIREEDWDLCFDESKAVFFVRQTNWVTQEVEEFSCREYQTWIASALLSRGFKNPKRTTLHKVLCLSLNNDALCFNEDAAQFYVQQHDVSATQYDLQPFAAQIAKRLQSMGFVQN